MTHRPRNPIFALCLLVIPLLAVPLAAQPTLKTIQVNGDLGDWTEILTNPDQVIPDGDGSKLPCELSSDLDCLVQGKSRDLRTFAWTYDDTYLYVFVRRQEPDSSTMVFWFYLDLNLDELMGSGDRVLRVKYQGSNRSTENDLYRYVPENPAGDAMTDALGRHDGWNMPGNLLSSSLWHEEAPNGGGPKGLEFEERVPWSKLGVPAATPVNFHVSSSNSPSPSNLAQQVDDNAGGTIAFSDVSILPPSGQRSVSPGSLSSFAHRIHNEGNRTDTFALTTRSSQGLFLTLLADLDCDGLGDELMGEDANGDGDFTDAADLLVPAWDSDDDGVPDTGAIAAGEAFCIVVEVETLPGMDGQRDDTTVTATSTKDPGVFAQAMDATLIGAISLRSDQAKSGVPGQPIPYPFEVCNTGGPTTVDLTAFSQLAFPVSLYDDQQCDGVADAFLARDEQGDGAWDQLQAGDTNGDGNPDTGPMPQATCLCYVARIHVPRDTAIGTSQVSRIVGTADTGGSAEVRFTSRVASRVEIFPDYTFAAGTEKITGAGKSVFFSHTVRNNWIVADEISLSGDNDHGWTVRFWTDPNGDGNITDGTLVTRIGPLAANGGQANIVAEVQVPEGLAPDTDSTSIATARSVLDPSSLDTATDELSVSIISAYSDPLFTFATRYFGPCQTIYVEATGLERARGGNVPDVYDLLYYDTNDQLVRLQDAFYPNSEGVAQDSYATQPGDPAGIWTVELREDGQTLAVLEITVESSGVIDPFRADRDSYPTVVSAMGITSWLRNQNTEASFLASSVEYLVLDPAGARYLDSGGGTGTFRSYTGVELTEESPIPPLPAGSSINDSFVVRDVTFPVEGIYTLSAVWRASCGTILAERTFLFTVGDEHVCDDGVDNDGDGLTDCEDPDCAVDPDCIESICNDGIDNDGDTDVDCDDSDCADSPYCLPEPICDDGIDNDGDTLVDCDDPDCMGDPACPEAICDDGIDNDGDTLIDCADPDCDEAPGCFEDICDDGIDNDGDGDVDCDDFDCTLAPACGGEDCDDGIDNDGDTLVDCDDPDCADAPGCFEDICDDGIDNDGDGSTDCDDPDCFEDPTCPESVCDDGIDNDGDGFVDCDDPDCADNPACIEIECADGIDNDGDGLVDCDDPDCVGDPACPETICDDGIDNDNDGLIDCEDPSCANDPACKEMICDDGIDNDGDGLIDCEDPDCLADPFDDCDGDGTTNIEDCAPADPGAFAVPPEVPGVRVHKIANGAWIEVSWADIAPAAGNATVYDLSTGRIGEIQEDLGFVRAQCLRNNWPVLMSEDRRVQVPSIVPRGFWHLVRGENVCGVGPWGFNSAREPRELPPLLCK